MRVLVVEDDKKIAAFVADGLKQAGYAVDVANDGKEGYLLATTTEYDAAILDVMLPLLDGLSLIERLRAKGIATPVLILSAKRTVDDRVTGLRAGGDDYMTKPFSFSEVLARVDALIRRATRQSEPTSLSAGELTLDLLTREAKRRDQALPLQPKEFALLEYMMRNRGRIVSKTSILEHVYDYSFDPQTNVVDVLMHRLRTKIDKGFEPKLIKTVRGAGYVLGP
ncbi:MAG TPA: response regulator transcription factor [Planctomycetota bacterium]|nr:response regulator transcription factor [Planctomycetota bacterium]